MSYAIKISKQRQGTFPKKLLDELKLNPGDVLTVKPADSGSGFVVVSQKEEDAKLIKKMAGRLGRKIKDKSKLLKTGEEFEEALEKSKMIAFKNRRDME